MELFGAYLPKGLCSWYLWIASRCFANQNTISLPANSELALKNNLHDNRHMTCKCVLHCVIKKRQIAPMIDGMRQDKMFGNVQERLRSPPFHLRHCLKTSTYFIKLQFFLNLDDHETAEFLTLLMTGRDHFILRVFFLVIHSVVGRDNFIQSNEDWEMWLCLLK